MAKMFWRACKQLLRIVWKYFKWLFLLTLPFTAMSIIVGITNGFLFAFWTDQRIDKNTDTWLYELKDLQDDWGVSEMTFRDFQDTNNDFHVLRLNSNDWAFKMGFIHPLEYGPDTDIPINKYGDLEKLMADMSPSCGKPPPKEQWVYISEFAWPLFSEWDTAFDAAVQAAYLPSALNNTRLFYAKCRDTAGFLCGIWGVRAPALVHFSVEDSAPLPEDIEYGLTYSTSSSNLRAVTARVIELPLKDAYTELPSSVFPSQKEQMLAIMRGDRLWEQFEPWNDLVQTMLRFHEYLDDDFYNVKGTFLNYLGEVDKWMEDHVTKPLDLLLVSQIVYEINFFAMVLVIRPVVLWPWHFVKELFLDFLGYPKRGDQILRPEL